MQQRRYATTWIRGVERRTFTVYAWNKDEAYVASRRQLEAGGDDARAWWFYGSVAC